MILILGGTTEGRIAVRVADEAGKPYLYSTKGNMQEIVSRYGTQVTGGMDEWEMTDCCLKHGVRLLVDAAHPFAVRLHATVARVSEALHLPVIRLERMYPPRTDTIVWCDDYEDAINKLEAKGIDRLLALTGVQTIGRLKPYWEKHNCYFRILERKESVSLAEEQGFDARKLVFYHSGEPEKILLEQLRPDAVLTKESGLSGGFREKVEAAAELGIPVFAVKRPVLPSGFVVVTGEHGLRKKIEQYLPGFYELRSGYTTGACATAASKAALLALMMGEEQQTVSFHIPDGEEMTLPVASTVIGENWATACVVKDAGDDPDVTDGCSVFSTVCFSDTGKIRFLQGEGVGKVTLPGLGLGIGEPAINRVPRQMITDELGRIYSKGLDVTISVPGGEELARRTFNPKLGIVGGISIIGTSGIVRPFSSDAFVDAIRREMEVACAVGAARIVINSGAKSEKYVKRVYPDLPSQAFIHYGNFIGETLKIAEELGVTSVTMGIMLGKAVKLAEGNLDTHSKKVVMDKEFLKRMAREAGCSLQAVSSIERITLACELWNLLPQEDAQLFFPSLLEHCMNHCVPLLPGGKLTIFLIDEEGNIAYRL